MRVRPRGRYFMPPTLPLPRVACRPSDGGPSWRKAGGGARGDVELVSVRGKPAPSMRSHARASRGRRPRRVGRRAVLRRRTALARRPALVLRLLRPRGEALSTDGNVRDRRRARQPAVRARLAARRADALVSMLDRKLLRREPDGSSSSTPICRASPRSTATTWSSTAGRAYVGNFGFDLDRVLREHGRGVLAEPPTAKLARVDPDGTVQRRRRRHALPQRLGDHARRDAR